MYCIKIRKGELSANFKKKGSGTVLGPGFPRDPRRIPRAGSPGGSPREPLRRIPERVGGINPNYVLYQNNKGGNYLQFSKKRLRTVLGPGFPEESPKESPREYPRGPVGNNVIYRNKKGKLPPISKKRVWGQFWGLDSPEDPPRGPPGESPEGSPGVAP